MTRDYNRYWVRTASVSHRPVCVSVSDLPCYFRVRHRLAVFDLGYSVPDLHLELRSFQCKREIESLPPPREILGNLRRSLIEDLTRPVFHNRQVAVRKVEARDVTLAVLCYAYLPEDGHVGMNQTIDHAVG